MNYILLVFSTVLLAVNFSLTKSYQKKFGTAAKTGLLFISISGLATALIFLAVNGFKLHITLFSILMATLQSMAFVGYTMLGFKIMEKENVSNYTFFLMTGGMIVPYVFGLMFLSEEKNALHFVGLILIVLALLFINGNIKNNLKTVLFCVAVFFLNGIVSVTSKVHQISENAIGTIDFVILTGIIKCILCFAVYLVINKKPLVKDFNIKASWISIFSAAISGFSYYLQLKGAISLPATVLYPIITGGSIIFTAIAGALCFKEKIKFKSYIGMALCFVGTCLFL